MQHIKNLATAFIILFAVASCKKEKINEPASQQPATKEITKYTWTAQNEQPNPAFYEHDQSGRLTSQKSIHRISTFNYSGDDKLTITEHKVSDNSLVYTYECTLNAKGAITKMIQRNSANILQSTTEITYNSNGDLTRVKEVYPASPTYEEVFEIVDGKAISSKVYYDGVLENSRYYSYDETQLNKNPTNHWYMWESYTLFGNIFKYKVTDFKDVNISGTIVWYIKTQYETDADGYITKQTLQFNHQGVTNSGVGTYTYK